MSALTPEEQRRVNMYEQRLEDGESLTHGEVGVLLDIVDRLAKENERQSKLATPLDNDRYLIGKLTAEREQLRVERDAYRRAKEENDERFIAERDAARARVAELEAEAVRTNTAHNDLHLQDLKDAVQKYSVCLAEVMSTRAKLSVATKTLESIGSDVCEYANQCNAPARARAALAEIEGAK